MVGPGGVEEVEQRAKALQVPSSAEDRMIRRKVAIGNGEATERMR